VGRNPRGDDRRVTAPCEVACCPTAAELHGVSVRLGLVGEENACHLVSQLDPFQHGPCLDHAVLGSGRRDQSIAIAERASYASLVIACSSCGQENPEGFRLCGMCGTALVPAAPARDERKVVTALFCDLVGSTAKAERMDPEDVRALLSSYHARVRGELERHGGTVEKFIGDAVMALFGAPVAHEDDPERAVRAALAICEAIAREGDLRVRIGITTGRTLVALGARPAEGEGMAYGDVVNTAARLQAAAAVGTILVDETTFRATERAISYREEPAVEAKGKAEPIHVWTALEARARFGTDVRQLGGGSLVGREPEMSLLIEMLSRVREEREPQLVSLIGVPGIGKSRLVWELFQHVDREPDIVTWRQGRSLPYGEGIALWALGEIVKAQAGILESDSREEAEAKLRRSVAEAVEEEVDWVEEHVLALIGGGADRGTDRRLEAFAAWRAFLEGLARRRPLVLVFEDLHWADDNLLDFVEYVAEWAGGVPLLAICTARPELLARRPTWGDDKANATTLRLSPLADEETARLVHDLLEQVVLPAELQAALLDRAGGNPLYAEEFVRMRGERGADFHTLPESVHGIIAARLDVLVPAEKELLQDAAVLGKVFWPGAVAAIGSEDPETVEQLLHALARKDFVRREQRSSLAGETEFAFWHALVRDVAYEEIPRAGRAARHARAAEWIEGLGRPEDHAELLAHHYTTALELTRASGGSDVELMEPTARALRIAGQRALALNAFPAAAEHFRAALELWPDDGAEQPELLFELGRAEYLARWEGRDALEAARDAFLALEDRERAAETEALLAELALGRGEGDLLALHMEQAEELVAELSGSVVEAHVLNLLGRCRLVGGGSDEEAIRAARQALAVAEELDLDDERAHALNTIGVARFRLGDLGGIEDVDRACEIARSSGSIRTIQRCAGNLAYVLQFVDLRRAIEVAKESEQLLERLGDTEALDLQRANRLSTELLVRPAWDELSEFCDDFIAACEAGSPHRLEPLVRHRRASLRLGRDAFAEALEDARKGLALARASGQQQQLVRGLADCASMLVEAGSFDEARALADEALALGPDSAIRLAWIADELGLGDDVRVLSDRVPVRHPWGEALAAVVHRDYERAADLFAQTGWSSEEALARLKAAERLVAEGRRADADEQLQRSLAFWRAAGATRYIREGEALFAATA
jgi:class 3 adenylate cyclase/tetratricopeptide (TPR) repeat protein